MRKSIFKNEKGQTLVIMFVIMVIALSIGIAVSSRFVGGLSLITQSDQSSRAIAVAEAAIEHLLLLPIATLEDYALNGTCGSDCTLSITSGEGQVMTANATLSKLGGSEDPYLIDLTVDETSQVNLVGYPTNTDFFVCWNEPDMSVTGIYIHGTVGSYEADAFSYNPPTTTHAENNFSTTTALSGYSNCITIASVDDSALLRLKAVYNEGFVVIIPASGEILPTQGILIESVGTAGNSTKTVSVIITDPILPAQFDYTIFQKSPSSALSN